MSFYKIILKNVSVAVSIGIHPHERSAPQKLLVSLELDVPVEHIVDASSIDGTVNYDPLREFILSWSSSTHAELIEDLLFKLVDKCFDDSRVNRVGAWIRKPEVFPETEEAGVGITVDRTDWIEATKS